MNFSVSNFIVFSTKEIILFSTFLQKYCLAYYYKLESSQNGPFS